MSDPPIDLSGTYNSSSGMKLDFDITRIAERYMVYLDGRSKGIANSTSDRAPGWKGAVGSVFFVSESEFENFKTNVIDKNVEWKIGEDNNCKIIPGTWNHRTFE